jgi:hypothetical protein
VLELTFGDFRRHLRTTQTENTNRDIGVVAKTIDKEGRASQPLLIAQAIRLKILIRIQFVEALRLMVRVPTLICRLQHVGDAHACYCGRDKIARCGQQGIAPGIHAAAYGSEGNLDSLEARRREEIRLLNH